jgi:hypothetical protein
VQEHFAYELRKIFPEIKKWKWIVKKCRCINCLLQSLCRYFRVVARYWGPKQVFTYDSDLRQGEKRMFAFY